MGIMGAPFAMRCAIFTLSRFAVKAENQGKQGDEKARGKAGVFFHLSLPSLFPLNAIWYT
jgi:hypothetical protein